MSYEAAVAWSIMRSLLAGMLCLALARVLRRGGFLNHGGTEARRESDQRSAVSGQPEASRRWTPVELPLDVQPSTLNSPPSPASPCLRASVVKFLLGDPRLRFGLLILPFFMPGLVVGYAYRNASLSLVQTPLLNELLYLAIVVAQFTPVVVLALEWLPPAALGPTGTFLLKLAAQSGRRATLGERLRVMLAGELPRQLTAGAIAALLCFQEVEVATLMQARGWAEWIFTKQAGGVELVEVLPFLVWPVGYGLLLTLPVLAFWTWDRLPACQAGGIHHGGTNRVSGTALAAGSAVVGQLAEPAASAVPLTGWLAIMGVAMSWLLVVLWPVTSLVLGAIRGAGVIRFRSALWQEIGDSLVLGVTVTLLLWVTLWGVQWWGGRRSRRATISPVSGEDSTARGPQWSAGRRGSPLAAGLLLLPGLLGSLALGLTIFEICQRIGVQPSYSPVPLVVGMVLFLLPRALALQAMLRRNEQQAGVFLAESLSELPGERGRQGATILWRVRDAGRFWTLALLFWWSYLELTLPALLRPAGMAPAPLRLYNFLHYGHIPGLAAMLVVVLAVPVVLLAVGRGLWRLRDR